MYTVRAFKPYKIFSKAQTGNAFSVLALFYIRDKPYFRFLSQKNFTKSVIHEHTD